MQKKKGKSKTKLGLVSSSFRHGMFPLLENLFSNVRSDTISLFDFIFLFFFLKIFFRFDIEYHKISSTHFDSVKIVKLLIRKGSYSTTRVSESVSVQINTAAHRKHDPANILFPFFFSSLAFSSSLLH